MRDVASARAPRPRAPRPAPRSSRRCRPRPAARAARPSRSANAQVASGRLTAWTATPVRRSNVQGIPKPTASTAPSTASRASSTASAIMSSSAAWSRPRTWRLVRWMDGRASASTAPGQQLGAAEIDADDAAARPRRPPYPAPCRPWPTTTRPTTRSTAPARSCFGRGDGDDGCATAAPAATARSSRRRRAARAAPAARPRAASRSGASSAGSLLAAGRLAAALAGAVPGLRPGPAPKISDRPTAQLEGSRLHADVAEHDPRPRLRRARRRARRSRARRRSASPSRSDTIMLMRVGGGEERARCRSRATRWSTSPATAATRSTPPTRSAARRWRSRRSSSTSASTINHLVEVNFENFPQLIDSLGGITYTGGCVVSDINGGTRNGGYTLRLRRGSTTSTASRRSRSPARARTSAPRARTTSRARAASRRSSPRSRPRSISPETFVRLPWVSWPAPKAIRSDMARPVAARPRRRRADRRQRAKHACSSPRAATTLPDGESAVSGPDADKRAAVRRFLKG